MAPGQVEGQLGWLGIVRVGLVQSALGAIVVLTTATLNRVMVVELALPASLPAALVAWHFAVQLSRPIWGHRSDIGGSRTPWIIGGMGLLSLGAILATNATLMLDGMSLIGLVLSVVAFTVIGVGVSAGGTSLLAFLATEVAPARRPAAAAIAWIMMVMGIAVTAGVSGALLDPYSPQRLALVAAGVAAAAFIVTLLAIRGMEIPGRRTVLVPELNERGDNPRFAEVLRQIWSENLARTFTLFVFFAMLAYSAQDLILEPYAGLVFGYTLGESTQLTSVQHGGVLLGMILVGLAGAIGRNDKTAWLKAGTFLGCVTSAAALLALGGAGLGGPTWLLPPVVFTLGFANGVFAVSAVGLMISYASAGRGARAGVRLGVWGAAQATAFGLGGLAGAVGLDVMRVLIDSVPAAFATVFAAEAFLFLVAAVLAARLGREGLHDRGLSFDARAT
ncbi:MAG: BCD family MFS transporter [Rhodospirillaceae bacterium]|nr:BCD family MFS transporter [Rhodospirillaceae bacterium]